MPDLFIEQAIYGSQGAGGYRFLARSPGFLDDWLPEAQRLCTAFGERPAGVPCPAAVFAQPLGKQHVAVVQVADQGTDDAGRPGALGFRFEQGRPLGLDGVFEPLVAPYVSGAEEAVQAILDEKWGEGGAYAGGETPFSPRLSVDHQVPRTSERAIEAVTALYDYCVQRYGHFPATIPPVAPGVWVQAHHLETAFYDHFYGPGSYPETVQNHMGVWHPAAE